MVFPSDANFLLVRVTAPNEIYQHLLNQGIVVRNRSEMPGCRDCLRFTVGSEMENEMLVEALEMFETE